MSWQKPALKLEEAVREGSYRHKKRVANVRAIWPIQTVSNNGQLLIISIQDEFTRYLTLYELQHLGDQKVIYVYEKLINNRPCKLSKR